MAVVVTYGGDQIPRSPFPVTVAPPLQLGKVKVQGLNSSEWGAPGSGGAPWGGERLGGGRSMGSGILGGWWGPLGCYMGFSMGRGRHP